MRGSYGTSIIGAADPIVAQPETRMDGAGVVLVLGTLVGVAVIARAVMTASATATHRREQAALEMWNPKLKDPARAIAHFRKGS